MKLYLHSFLFSAYFFILSSFYLYARRGFYDLYIVNKILAGVALILLGYVLLIGPFSRLYTIFDHFIIYRKSLGIIAFLYALLHSAVSLFFLPDRFPITYFQSHFITFVFGLSALGVLTILLYYSFDSLTGHLDRKVWWHIHNWGVRIGGILILLHVVPMKYAGWSQWYIKGGNAELAMPFLPPAGLLVLSFGVFVLTVRLLEFLRGSLGRIAVEIAFILFLLFLIGTFTWGMVLKFSPMPFSLI